MEGRESERQELERQKLLGKSHENNQKREPLELGNSITAVNRASILKPRHLSFP